MCHFSSSFVHSPLVGTLWQTAPTLSLRLVFIVTEVWCWMSNRPLQICMIWIHLIWVLIWLLIWVPVQVYFSLLGPCTFQYRYLLLLQITVSLAGNAAWIVEVRSANNFASSKLVARSLLKDFYTVSEIPIFFLG